MDFSGRPAVSPGVEAVARTAREVLDEAGATLDHVAHAVPSIRQALILYRDLLGGEVTVGGIHPMAGHAAAHVLFRGGGKLELLEPTAPDSASVGAFLAANPQGGLHHVTFRVADIRAVLAAFERGGYRPFGTNFRWPMWQETFLHPRETGGVLLQIVQMSDDLPKPGISLEQMLAEAEVLRSRSGARTAEQRQESEGTR
jgi:methylmalonyl-CoA/ethylmalonyl-CoA epimerase